MRNRMIFNLCLWPLLVLLLGIALWFFLAIFIPGQISGVAIFSKLAEKSAHIAPLALWGCVTLSSLMALFQVYTYWRWENGKASACCFNCGGIVAQRFGRYGLYVHCLACGKNSGI